MDHTIQVGCKKAFVVLKVPVEYFVAHRALQLTDVEVLYGSSIFPVVMI
jgi:hypothetical protein